MTEWFLPIYPPQKTLVIKFQMVFLFYLLYREDRDIQKFKVKTFKKLKQIQFVDFKNFFSCVHIPPHTHMHTYSSFKQIRLFKINL